MMIFFTTAVIVAPGVRRLDHVQRRHHLYRRRRRRRRCRCWMLSQKQDAGFAGDGTTVRVALGTAAAAAAGLELQCTGIHTNFNRLVCLHSHLLVVKSLTCCGIYLAFSVFVSFVRKRRFEAVLYHLLRSNAPPQSNHLDVFDAKLVASISSRSY
jgi:hypothetical protein